MDQGYTDYLDFYRRSPYAPYLQEQRMVGSAPVRMVFLGLPAGDHSGPSLPEVLLCIGRHGTSMLRTDLGAGAWRGQWQPGEMFLAPAGNMARYTLEGAAENFGTAIPVAALQTALEEARPGFVDFGRLHAAPFRDQFVERLCRRMWDEAAESGALGSLFADGAVLALAVSLLRLSAGVSALPQPKGGLAPFRLRRALDYMEANLPRDLQMADLAAVAGLSQRHFARAFRARTGLSPHRYMVEQRVERAKTLLSTTDLTFTQVALACGFSSQSHLALWFRRSTGTTPKTYRDSRQL